MKCVHHWVIEEANGPTSKGRCKKCKKVKQHTNYIEGGWWGNDDPKAEK